MAEEISCHWGHEISNSSIRSLQGPTLENQLIWISVLTGTRERLGSSIFLSVWYCLIGSLKVTYFSFASLHSNTDGWLQNILVFLTDCLFYICRYVYFSWTLCASFSGTSLTPLREFGLEIWFEIELASLFFLLFPPFTVFSSLMLTYTTAVPCFSMPGYNASFHQPLNMHMI